MDLERENWSVTGEFPAQRVGDAEKIPFEHVTMYTLHITSFFIVLINIQEIKIKMLWGI